MTLYKLRAIYKDLGIVYSRPKLVNFRAKRDSEELATKRLNFAIQLNRLFEKGKHLIFTDETSMHSWMRREKLWQLKGKPL